MKKSHFFSLSFLLFMLSCSTFDQTISVEKDAHVANELSIIQTHKYSYNDMDQLKNLLVTQIQKYEMGLGFLRKSAELYTGGEKARYQRSIEQVVIELNYLRSYLANFNHYYPDQWSEVQEKMATVLERIKKKYQTIYQELI